MDTDTLRSRIADGMPRTIDELSRLVSIPSIGYPGYDPAHVRASAELTGELLRGAGASNARLIELGDGHPAVFAEIPGPEGAPTILLYAHHDVQPEGDAAAWTSGPFAPEIRDGRLYGRGAADDKAGVAVHAAALRALGADEGVPLPATVKIVVEGEEECSTEHLPDLVRGQGDLLKADVAVVADGGNYRTGVPTIGTSVRGVTDCRVTVSVLPIAQHSGSNGGPIPDAITALARMIATLHDDDGNVAIRRLNSFEWTGMQVPEDEFREESRVFDSVRLIGSGSLADRLLSKPAVNVLGFDAPPVAGSSNQIVPTASARVSLRLAPGDAPGAGGGGPRAPQRGGPPRGGRVGLEGGEAGQGYLVDTTTDAFEACRDALAEAFEADVVEIGSGGSIPLVPMLAETFPGMAVLIIGAGDERSNYHSIDESVDLRDLERLALAEALLIRNLGG